MNFPYEDIVSLPHPVSSRHAPMDAAGRAAQFAPFAALNGHAAAIAETARLTSQRPQLAEDAQQELDRQLILLLRQPQRSACLTYFVPDCRKAGGAVVTKTAALQKWDAASRTLVLDSGDCIPLADLLEIRFP